MKSTYFIGVEILTPERKLLDYGILQAQAGSLKLLTTRFKGTVLGGSILLLFGSVYWFLIAAPFLFLHVAPITNWDPAFAGFFVIAVPITFLAILLSSMGLVRRIQVFYQKSSRDVTVSDVQPGRFHHTMTAHSDKDSLVLMASCRRSNFDHAMALAGQINL